MRGEREERHVAAYIAASYLSQRNRRRVWRAASRRLAAAVQRQANGGKRINSYW